MCIRDRANTFNGGIDMRKQKIASIALAMALSTSTFVGNINLVGADRTEAGKNTNARAENEKDQIGRIEKELEALKKDLANKLNEKTSLEKEKKALEEEIKEAKAKLGKELKKAEEKLEEVKKAQAQDQEQIDKANKRIQAVSYTHLTLPTN